MTSSERPAFAWSKFATRLMLLVIFALATGSLFNGLRGLYDTSETRYTESAREMVASGDWLVPRLEGEPHLTKPPMTYWGLASSISLFGHSEWAVRLPSVIVFAMGAWLTALLARELTGREDVAMTAGLLQLAAPLALTASHVVTSDGLLTMLEFGYTLCFWKTLNAPEFAKARRWALMTWGVAGLAFLTKGPPGMLLALVCLVYCVLDRRNISRNWRALVRPEALALFFVVALSWYVAVFLTVPNATRVWKTEALHKVFVESQRNMSAFLYAPILLGGALPAVLVLLVAWWKRRSEWRTCGSMFIDSQVATFCALWVGLLLVIFMVVRTRLPLYILPLVAPVNILAATALLKPNGISHDGNRGAPVHLPLWLKIVSGCIIVLFVGNKFYMGTHDDESKDMRPLAQAILQDSKEIGKEPFLVITMPVMGNGLLYYLDGPEYIRLQRNQESAGAELHGSIKQLREDSSRHNKGRSAQLASALQKTIRDEQAEYIVFQSDALAKYEERFGDYVKLVMANDNWAVWRRLKQLSADDYQTSNSL